MTKKILYKNNLLLALILFFCGQWSSAQLTDFTLNVAVTQETCTGNGALNFETTGTTPGATMLYSVYLLPDTVTPIAVLSDTSFTGLTSGDYLVVATQTLGNLTNSQQQNVTILNQITPLTFQVTGTPESCANGTITVTAQGNVATYETISGPVIVPPQTSNVMTGLSAGTYNIRVTDTCGDAYVQTYTLIGATYLTLSGFEMQCEMLDCDTTLASFIINSDVNLPEMEIVYPLFITYTVYPPGGGTPVTATQMIASGDNHEITVTGEIPYFEGEYTCDITVADSCGHTFTMSGNDMLGGMTTSVDPIIGPPNGITIDVCQGVPPYTVTFGDTPAGFNPANHNPNHPGPFTTLPIVYMSTPEHEMPEGDYEVIVTDSCGNAVPGHCGIVICPTSYRVDPVCPKHGRVTSPDTGGTPLMTGWIASAPPEFPFPLPFNLASYIDSFGNLSIDLPPGEYAIEGLTTCQTDYRFLIQILEPHIEAEGLNEYGCRNNSGSIKIKLVDGLFLSSVVITSAPAGFNGNLPFDASSFITADPKQCDITGLIAGDYVLSVTDFCGNVYPVNVNVPVMVYQGLPVFASLPGCGVGYGAIAMSTLNGAFVQVMVLAAPAGYPSPLPHDVTSGINSNGAFALSNLPEGTYTFYTRDACGVEQTFTQSFTGFHIVANDVTVRGNCGSFDLDLRYSPNNPYGQAFWLQRYNATDNVWEHPITGVDYEGTASAINSILLLNDAVNYNIAVLGQFRIIRTNMVYTTGSNLWTICSEVIKEFEFTGQLRIQSAYSIPCSNGVSQVFIIAGDTFPLEYRITEKDGQPFFVDNGNSNVFSGLEPGIYNFQVEDQCGNIANRLFDIVSLSEPAISAFNLCEGQNGYLSVQAISYLSYQWWNANDPGTILSTTSKLYFSPFSATTTPGTYFVRIYSTSSLSCIDTTISYTIPPVYTPNAGQDATITLCGSNRAIDLFTLLGGTFDQTGYWQEISGSGMLNGHMWLPMNLPHGTYVFRYHVDGFCTDFDEATLTIDFRGFAPVPTITVDQQQCSGGPIAFTASTIPEATYHWVGPANFTSDVQNPVIENSTALHSGAYTLTITVNECTASATTNVLVTPSPEFIIAQFCQNGAYTLKADPVGNDFDPDVVTYSWSGPQNFVSTDNPTVITGMQNGTYELTVTGTDGCSTSQSIQVNTTRCTIPTGISPNNDGDNDVFDLTGFDILKFKIFNRYGRMVFEQDGYTNQWHGQDFKGRELPDATYYYYIKLRSGEERTGWVYVTK
ncbi:gliding motility-associated C-terminal domain-containing protein [Flavobacterium sp.]|uniref:gliding motility-associated C-terminal domain-containing protein n=1 Tax=Flavobacterium sp. TaxID=239 RepID=UPI0039E4FA35